MGRNRAERRQAAAGKAKEEFQDPEFAAEMQQRQIGEALGSADRRVGAALAAVDRLTTSLDQAEMQLNRQGAVLQQLQQQNALLEADLQASETDLDECVSVIEAMLKGGSRNEAAVELLARLAADEDDAPALAAVPEPVEEPEVEEYDGPDPQA